MSIRSILAATLAAALLGACASTPDRLAVAPTCGAERQVTVTTRGTRLALRPGLTAKLQKASRVPGESGVVLSCQPDGGSLKRCVVLFEDAPGEGYGKAARAWAQQVIYPTDGDARTVEVRVRFGPPPAGDRRCS
ncbi:MAG: hypothetical protein Q7J28_11020 [Caulobacter sp.]|nr:hypothetical protein [Caulobacter sp.]